MSLAGHQINPIDINFHLQKSLEIFDNNSADKIQFKKDKGLKVPCLMPIGVNTKGGKAWTAGPSEPGAGGRSHFHILQE